MERFLRELKTELPYNPAIPLLGIYLEKNQNLKRYMHPNVPGTTVYNSQDRKQTKCLSTEEWIKMWYIYNAILLLFHY